MQDYGYSKDAQDNYLYSDCETRGFWEYYSTMEGKDTFGALFDQSNAMNHKFLQFWDLLAEKFARNPYIAGFEPINEPYSGNNVKDPTLNIPGVMDVKHLTPLYSKIYQKLQSESKSA